MVFSPWKKSGFIRGVWVSNLGDDIQVPFPFYNFFSLHFLLTIMSAVFRFNPQCLAHASWCWAVTDILDLGQLNCTLTMLVVWLQGLKFSWCHIGCYIECRMGCSDINKKNKLQIPPVNHEMNLLSLINPSLPHVYYSTTVSNHGLIRLKKFVSQISRNLCN
jgi:hypothetical protein